MARTWSYTIAESVLRSDWTFAISQPFGKVCQKSRWRPKLKSFFRNDPPPLCWSIPQWTFKPSKPVKETLFITVPPSFLTDLLPPPLQLFLLCTQSQVPINTFYSIKHEVDINTKKKKEDLSMTGVEGWIRHERRVDLIGWWRKTSGDADVDIVRRQSFDSGDPGVECS
jgi:hypothetical protein